MSDKPLLTPGTKPATGSPVWVTLLIAGAASSISILCLGLFWFGVGYVHVSAALAAVALTATILGGIAVFYWVAVRSITGTWKGAWSLPDGARLIADADPADSLRRVLGLVKGTVAWLPWTASDSTLTLTRKGWWGEIAVQVVAVPVDGGTQLDFRVGSEHHVQNLIGRAIGRALIARLVREISAATEWTRL